MKKKTIAIVSLIIAIVLLAVGTNYLLSLRSVSFTLAGDVTKLTIYGSDKQKKKTITSKDSVLLQEGSYYAIAEGKNISNNPLNFTVEQNDNVIHINPSYSKEYLGELLVNEKPAVAAAIATKYPSIINGYVLSRETLYGRGDWLGGLLEPIVSDKRDQRDPYRIVLRKKDGNWEVVRRPEYVLTSSRYADVPIEILKSINSIDE